MPKKLENGRLQLPGEWTLLITALVIFATRYVKIVVGIVNPALAHTEAFQSGISIVSALFLAMVLTRTTLKLRVALA